MLVRPARHDDTDSIAEVFVASFGGLLFLPRLHTKEEDRSWVREVMVPGHEIWVAEIGGDVVGFAALHEDLLGHLYVHPGAQRQGVGATLLDVVKRERPEGFRLWTFQRNEGARRFYERHGCRLVELTDGTGNEQQEPDVLYAWAP